MGKLLIVVDMQKDFIDGALGTPEAQAIVPRVVKKIRSWNGDIVFTRDTHLENYMDTQEGKRLPVPHCIRGTAGHELQQEVQAACDEKKAVGIDKLTFGSKELVEYLLSAYPDGLEEIELIGLCTDICVISNALLMKAFFAEIPVSVDASCCAGVTPKSHENALEAMKLCQVEIIDE